MHVKSESEYAAPIGDILKQHAADFSLDADLGASRLNSAISQHGYHIDAHAGTLRLPDTPGNRMSTDEETICYSVRIATHKLSGQIYHHSPASLLVTHVSLPKYCIIYHKRTLATTTKLGTGPQVSLH